MMNDSCPSPPNGHLLVLPQTDRWSSAIMEHASRGPIQVRVFNSTHELAQQFALFPLGIAIIEICERILEKPDQLHAIFDARFNSIPKFAVGGHDTRHQHLEWIRAGFAEAFHSTADVARLLRIAANYFQNQPASQLSIEQIVDRDLPWGPISE